MSKTKRNVTRQPKGVAPVTVHNFKTPEPWCKHVFLRKCVKALLVLIVLCIAGCTEGYEYQRPYTYLELSDYVTGPVCR